MPEASLVINRPENPQLGEIGYETDYAFIESEWDTTKKKKKQDKKQVKLYDQLANTFFGAKCTYEPLFVGRMLEEPTLGNQIMRVEWNQAYCLSSVYKKKRKL